MVLFEVGFLTVIAMAVNKAKAVKETASPRLRVLPYLEKLCISEWYQI
jgi:hypothetical protein